MGSGLYGCLWTSLPTSFISAQRLSEHTIYHNAQSTECEIPAHALSKVGKNLKVMAIDGLKHVDQKSWYIGWWYRCIVCHHM